MILRPSSLQDDSKYNFSCEAILTAVLVMHDRSKDKDEDKDKDKGNNSLSLVQFSCEAILTAALDVHCRSKDKDEDKDKSGNCLSLVHSCMFYGQNPTPVCLRLP